MGWTGGLGNRERSAGVSVGGPRRRWEKVGPGTGLTPAPHGPSVEVQVARMAGPDRTKCRVLKILSAWQRFLVTACSAIASPGPYLRPIT